METIQKNKSGVVFARSASTHTVLGQSIADQEKSCRKFATDSAICIDRTFAAVGSGDTQLVEMLEYVQLHRPDFVIVRSLDRLGRNYDKVRRLYEAIREAGSELLVATNPYADTELIIDIFAVFARHENKVRSDAIKRGIARRKERLQDGSKISDGLLHRNSLRATI